MNHRAASWWALRTDGDPAALAGAVREVVRRAGSETLINEMQPMDSLVVQAQAQTRFSLLLIGVFSTIAALLAGVGLYGVLATCDFGPPANCRDWSADGPGRCAVAYLSFDGREGTLPT